MTEAVVWEPSKVRFSVITRKSEIMKIRGENTCEDVSNNKTIGKIESR